MRRRAAQSGVQFSLFPFLAVLLCTMGSLIVLMLVLVQKARVEAVEKTATPVASAEDIAARELRQQQAEEERAKLASMATQLDELRASLKDKLQASSLNLSHLEDHIRRLRDQLAKMEADYQVLKQQQDFDSMQQQRAEVVRLQGEIAKAKAELDDAKRQAATKPRSYAIVPYDGNGGTRRRPIYLECRADQLIIHPEGNVLLPIDLQDSGAGNPLAAALRATREHLSDTSGLQGGEPYPLLLVRPDGAKTYAAAMHAMSSWTSEYGYELIDAEMQLEFPPADEVLGDKVRRTVRLARERQLAIAEARARSFGVRSGSGGGGAFSDLSRGGGGFLTASRNGGFELQGGRQGDDWLDSHVAKPGADVAASQNPAGNTRGGFYATEQPGTSSATSSGANNSATGEAGERRPLRDGDVASNAAAGNFAPSENSQAGPSFGSAADDSADEQDASANANVPAVAAARGGDWALPSKARGATPFSRPIRVQVTANQLIVLPDRGENGTPRVTQLNGPMQSSIDNFVSQLWEHMNGWGIAGSRAYWKPILSVEVTRGGEARFAELSALMRESGVEVQWKR